MRIALDAMGGDRAPEEIVKGALLALEEYPEAEILLVGRTEAIEPLLGDHRDRVQILHAPEVVEMHESAVQALRKKRNSSISKTIQLLAAGEVEAVISAGHTGAVVANSTVYLKPLEGVKRCGIAVSLPAGDLPCVVIDVGANLDCKPIHLSQYGVMASVYSHYMYGVESPRVGLLNIGQENVKGNNLAKETFDLLSAGPLNFVGNAEGRDIYLGHFDVIVCEGFVGNVVLKVTEGLAESLVRKYENELLAGLTRIPDELQAPIETMRRHSDYAEYGGAPLLGTGGVVIICHGSSGARAIKNAIKEALEFTAHRVNDAIVEQLSRVKA